MKLFNIFKRKPKQYYVYNMFCRTCDIIVTRMNAYENKCPMCGNYMEVYSCNPIKGKVYNDNWKER